MAKDDYFVIVYQILSYLYKCLKEGTRIDERLIRYDSKEIPTGTAKRIMKDAGIN